MRHEKDARQKETGKSLWLRVYGKSRKRRLKPVATSKGSREALEPVAGLFGHLAVVVTPHVDDLAHLVDARPEADADAVDEALAALLVEGLAHVLPLLGVRVVRGEDRRLLVVVAVVDDIKDGLFNPGGRPLGAQFIEDDDLAQEDGRQDV